MMIKEINWNNKKEVLIAVNQNGAALEYASEQLQNDKEVVLTAVNQNGNALLYVSKDFKNDKEVALAAVNQDADALYDVSERLKNDKDLVLIAVTKDGCALNYASENLQNDLDLLNLLYNYYNLPENKIENEYSDNQQWFLERMKIRDILMEQKLLQDSIPDNKKPVKSRFLKF